MPTDPDDPDVSGPAGSQVPDGAELPVQGVVPEAERYTREGLLGKGGMGVVYLARDHRLERAVALKEAAHAGAMASRLVREATVTAGLDHPGIVTVHDSGVTEDGRPFYTMRLVRGRPLSSLLAERRSLPERLGLVRHYLDTCNAVAYAHAHGIVHRDLKPANVMVGGFGETQVVDWGLATRFGEAEGVPSGTPAYMSPEQARGEPADPRADVWSLGAMLYELLTRQSPLGVGSAEELTGRARVGGRVPAPAIADAPPELVAIAERALAADAAGRYPDAGALALDVAAWIDGRPVHAHRYTPWELLTRLVRAWRGPLAVAGMALVLVIGLSAFGTWQIAEERDRVTAAEKETRAALATSDANLAEALIAEARGALVHGSTAVAAVLASHAVTLADAPEAWGVLAATSVSTRAERMDQQGLPACARHLPLGPDDLVCVTAHDIQRWTGDRAKWTWRGVSLSARVQGAALYVERPAGTVTVVDLETGAATEGLVSFRINGGPLWPVRAADWDLGRSDRALNELASRFCPGDAAAAAAFSVDRGRYAVLCEDGRVGADRIGALPEQYFQSTATRVALSGVVAAELTPDDRYLVLGGTKGKIAVIALDSGATSMVATAADDAAWLVELSEDGTRLVIGGDRGDVEVRTLPDLEPVVRVPVPARAARFVSDGTLMLATTASASRWRLPTRRTVDLLRGPDGVTQAVFSPDGAHLALALGRYEASVWDTSSGARRVTFPLGAATAKAAAFTPDGSTVWFGLTGANTEAWQPRAVRLDGGPAPRIPEPLLVRRPGGDAGFQARRAVILRSGVLIAVGYGRGPGQLLAVDTVTLEPVALDGCPDVEWFDGAQSPGGEYAVLVGDGGQVVSIADGEHLACRAAVRLDGATAADVQADGGLVVGVDTTVAKLDAAGTPLWTAEYPGGRVLDVAVSADGRWVAAGGTDHGRGSGTARETCAPSWPLMASGWPAWTFARTGGRSSPGAGTARHGCGGWMFLAAIQVSLTLRRQAPGG